MMIERDGDKITFYYNVKTGNEGDLSQRRKKRFGVEKRGNKAVLFTKQGFKAEVKLNQPQLQNYIKELQSLHDEMFGTKLAPVPPKEIRIVKY